MRNVIEKYLIVITHIVTTHAKFNFHFIISNFSAIKHVVFFIKSDIKLVDKEVPGLYTPYAFLKRNASSLTIKK